MASIKGKDTKPELTVRKFLFGQGFRYRLHNSKLPGKPDIVLSKYKTVIFVNGCYWHRHSNCKLCTTPKTNVSFWLEKFRRNIERDLENYDELKKQGWRVIIVWQCEVKSQVYEEKLLKSLRE